MTSSGPLLETLAQAALVFDRYQTEKRWLPREGIEVTIERRVRSELERARRYVVLFQVKAILAISALASLSIAGFYFLQPHLGSEWTASLIAVLHLTLLSGVVLLQKSSHWKSH